VRHVDGAAVEKTKEIAEQAKQELLKGKDIVDVKYFIDAAIKTLATKVAKGD
jgi:hypothetical protein